jgi:hypothetical protein
MKTTIMPCSRGRNKGMLLFIAIFLMLVLFMVSSAFVSLVCNDYYTSSLGISTTEVFWFADAGVDYMIEVIRAQGIYSPFIPIDLNGYDDGTGYTGFGPKYVSDPLMSKGKYEGRFEVKVRLHPEDWRGRGQVVVDNLGVQTTETYPAAYGALNPYPTPNKFRPYLLLDTDLLRGNTAGVPNEPRLNRLIIESTGFFFYNNPAHPYTGNGPVGPAESVMQEKKSIYAIYSMTTEDLEWWTEKLH